MSTLVSTIATAGLTYLTGGTAAPLMAGAAGGSSIMSMLSTGLSLASAGLSLFGGMQAGDDAEANAAFQARALEMQAKDDELAAKQEELRGKQEANDMTSDMIRTISAQRLTAAANGLDFTFGTPDSVTKTTRNIAEAQLSIGREDAQMKALSRRRQAAERRLEGANVRISGGRDASAARMRGIAGAVSSVGDLAMRRAERG